MEVTLNRLRSFCVGQGMQLEIERDGGMFLDGLPLNERSLAERIAVSEGRPIPALQDAPSGAPSAVLASDVLDKAASHMKARASTYDKPEGERSMLQTVAVFNAFHGTRLTEAQGWHFMQVLKDVRLFTRAGYHADSAEDGVAYAALKAEAKAAEVQQAANDNPAPTAANRA